MPGQGPPAQDALHPGRGSCRPHRSLRETWSGLAEGRRPPSCPGRPGRAAAGGGASGRRAGLAREGEGRDAKTQGARWAGPGRAGPEWAAGAGPGARAGENGS